MAVLVDERTVDINGKVAGPLVQYAFRRLHAENPFSTEGEIEWIAGLLHAALGEIHSLFRKPRLGHNVRVRKHILVAQKGFGGDYVVMRKTREHVVKRHRILFIRRRINIRQIIGDG